MNRLNSVTYMKAKLLAVVILATLMISNLGYAADGDGAESCGLWSDINPLTEKFMPGGARGKWTEHLRPKICKNYEILAVMKGHAQGGYNKGEFACNRRVILPRNLGSYATYDVESYCMPEVERFFNVGSSSFITTYFATHIKPDLINYFGPMSYQVAIADGSTIMNQMFVYHPEGRSRDTFARCSDDQWYDSSYVGQHNHFMCTRFYCLPPMPTPWGHQWPKLTETGKWSSRIGYSAGATQSGIENGYHLDYMTRFLQSEDLYLMNYSIFGESNQIANLKSRLGDAGFNELDTKLKDLTGEGLDMPVFYLQVACRTEELEDAPKGWNFFQISVPHGQTFKSTDLEPFSRPARTNEVPVCGLDIGSPCDPNDNKCPSYTICIGNAGNETCQLCGYEDTYCCTGNTCNSGLTCNSDTNQCQAAPTITIGSKCDPNNSMCPAGTVCMGNAGNETCRVCGDFGVVCCADNKCNSDLSCDTASNTCQKTVGLGIACSTSLNIACEAGLTCDAGNTNVCIKVRDKGESCDSSKYEICKDPYQCVDGICKQLVCIKGECNQAGANCASNKCPCDGTSNNFCDRGFECVGGYCQYIDRCVAE